MKSSLLGSSGFRIPTKNVKNGSMRTNSSLGTDRKTSSRFNESTKMPNMTRNAP